MFKDKNFSKKLISLVLPISMQQLMLSLVSVTDALMLGFLSQDALSAVSLAGQVMFVYSLFTFSASSGISILAAQYWGLRDKKSIEKVLACGLRMIVPISVVFTLGALIFPTEIMRMFASDDVLIDSGALYLRSVALSYLFLSVSQCCLCYLTSRIQKRLKMLENG